MSYEGGAVMMFGGNFYSGHNLLAIDVPGHRYNIYIHLHTVRTD